MKKKKKRRSEFSLLRDYKSRQWKDALSPIENDFLKIKVACIIFWDFYDEENKICPVYLKKLVRSYDSFSEEMHKVMYKNSEVWLELRRIGYPPKLSKRRAFLQDETINDY